MLLLVILILTLISVLVLSWAREWRTELKLARNFGQAQKCRLLAESGVFYALGKVLKAKSVELAENQSHTSESEVAPGDLWEGDQRPHYLELPDGKVEVRIGDEGGKIDLNHASEEVLRNLFTVLGVPELQSRIMVDSLQDWRSRDEYPRPYGAKDDYYLRLDPPYVAKNGIFERVEELAWVRGFGNSPLVARLGQWLTVQATSQRVNVNTAPLEVLLTLGFSRGAAEAIIASRQTAPFRNLTEVSRAAATPISPLDQRFFFKSSPFFTITATGMVKNSQGRYTIKVLARVDAKSKEPWTIYSWFDGYPG